MFRRAANNELDGAVVVGSPPEWWSIARPWVMTLLLIAFTGVYFYLGRHLINQTNSDRNRSDQQNNIKLTKIAYAHAHPEFSEVGTDGVWNWFPHHTDGVVNPLWPWIAARAVKADDDDEAIFLKGKWLNLYLTYGLLVIGAAFAATYFSIPATLNLLLLAGLGAFLPRAVWFQPEPLFFMTFLLAWVIGIAALLKTSLLRYLLFGILVGLAYLAKASALPLLAAFLGVGSIRWLWSCMRSLLKRDHDSAQESWCPRAHLVGSVLCLLAFFLTTGPRLGYANERFGDPLHSYPAYWMWMDQFEPDGIDFLLNHRSSEELEAINPEEKPSLSNYLKNNGKDHFKERLTVGTQLTAKDFFSPKQAKVRKQGPDPWRVLLPERGSYLYALAGGLLVLWLWSLVGKPRAESRLQRLHPETTTVLMFVIGAFLLYLLLYGWYRPIGKGDRFMLSMYAPVVVALIWGAESIRSRIVARGGQRVISTAYFSAHWILTTFILVRIIELATHPAFFTK